MFDKKGVEVGKALDVFLPSFYMSNLKLRSSNTRLKDTT